LKYSKLPSRQGLLNKQNLKKTLLADKSASWMREGYDCFATLYLFTSFCNHFSMINYTSYSLLLEF